MTLQPASGARDLNPQQVRKNHLIASKLSSLYQLWGYERISPPHIERLDTLMAAGGISNNEILKIVSDEPLGLRPEITASIVRAASTRFNEYERPLRFGQQVLHLNAIKALMVVLILKSHSKAE